MSRLSAADLREATLWRQFPQPGGRAATDVLTLLSRLGPVQSQAPRSPFLTASSRQPGVGYAVVRDLFASFRLVKTSSLRGTVHTSVAEQYPWCDAVARDTRAGALRRQLGLVHRSVAEVEAALEAYADADWRPRSEVVDHLRGWLAEHESPASAERLTGTYRENLVWGHSGLLRRARDDRWEKRTDIYHRRARAVLPACSTPGAAESLSALVRVYLGALGPATRHDLAYFFGTGLTSADAAVTALGEEVVRLPGPEGEVYLDLAEPPPAEPRDLGVRLLPEFDALVVGYAAPHRGRFLSTTDLESVWARLNGQFAPVVLQDDHLVATWRTVTTGSRTVVEVTPMPGHPAPPEDLLGRAAADAARALDLELAGVHVLG